MQRKKVITSKNIKKSKKIPGKLPNGWFIRKGRWFVVKDGYATEIKPPLEKE